MSNFKTYTILRSRYCHGEYPVGVNKKITAKNLLELYNKGIKLIVVLIDNDNKSDSELTEMVESLELIENSRIELYFAPIKQGNSYAVDKIKSTINYINDKMADKNAVYVCSLHESIADTFLACYVIKHKLSSISDIMLWLYELQGIDYSSLNPPEIFDCEQLQIIKKFADDA